MPSAEYLNPDTMSTPPGYTHVVKAGNVVYIAGQISRGKDGSIVGPGDAEAQVRQIWRNIEAAVKSVGGTLPDVVKTTTYMIKPEYTAVVRKVRDEVFPTSVCPSSTFVIIPELASPDYLVEIESIAVVG